MQQAELWEVNTGGVMFLSIVLSILRSRSFRWSPALDLTDRSVYSTLIPGAQY